MRKTAVGAALLLLLVACSPGEGESTTTTTQAPATTTTLAPATTTTEAAMADFPATVAADNGEVTIDERPESIVSISATATEMLFAIGAGPQVIAVDDQSNYPAEAPMTDLSGFTPNVEAILAFEPDLVVISFDPGDVVASLEAADVAVISYGSAFTIDDVYRQIEGLGIATGQIDGAVVVNESIQNDLEKLAADAPDGAQISYYHEIDSTLFTATSTTFIGQLYSLFGLNNIADPADEDGSAFGFPQLSSEFVVGADPDLIFLSNTLYGESVETVSARPGWDVMSAVMSGNIVELDSDVSSRWGPRIVEFAQSVADALDSYVSES